MIKPKDKDIGRRVIYRPSHGDPTTGIISSFSDKFVFVRYSEGDTAAATKRKDLEWDEVNGQGK